MSASLAIRGLAVCHGSREVLHDVDLDVAAGEVVAVLGPSGSGKTTLLRTVAGLAQAERGTISLDGRDLSGVPPHQRGIGMMFQDHALFPHRDVGGNVAFGLRMLGERRVDQTRRVDELLDLVGLRGFERRRVQTLSGGEQQRVALARSLAPRPDVLLLDEPLGALDRLLREHLVSELRSLFTSLGVTVVAVTHDHGEAFGVADRVVIMDDGWVLQEGPPREVWSRPANRRVGELLGFTNIVEAVVRDGRADTPWGAVVVDAEDGVTTLLIRPAGIELGSDGTRPRATVRSTVFAGDRTTVVIEVPGAPRLEASVGSTSVPQPGDQVVVTLDPSEVVVVGP